MAVVDMNHEYRASDPCIKR